MYSGSGLSISPIEEMANCYIEIDYRWWIRQFLRHAPASYDYDRNLAEKPYGHPADRYNRQN